MSKCNPGVSGMSVYVPRPRVQLNEWCDWTGNSWPKVQTAVGNSFRRPAPYEDVYTMAATAVLRLILNYDIDPREVGLLALGTETSKDNSAGAVIVRGMVDRGLEDLGRPRLSRRLEVPEFKHACLGGIYALKNALRYVSCDGAGHKAIVVCSDVAEYERGSSGEQTQGAGAVAMLVEATPRLFEVDLDHAGSASAYRGPDFRKPFARHFLEGYPQRGARMHDFPVFNGKYSTFAYLDATGQAVDAMLERLGMSGRDVLDAFGALFFHRPYHMMPVHGLSFLYVRALARSQHDSEEFHELCRAAGVSPQTVIEECRLQPDLFGDLVARGVGTDAMQEPLAPYPATADVSACARKSTAFQTLLATRMSLGSDWARELGNLYTAALPAWLAAGFEQALDQDIELADMQMLAVGYGSGDAAEAWPLRAVPSWRDAAARIGLRAALSSPIDLSQRHYEALHDGDDSGFDCPAHEQFVISRTGQTYAPAFQDLGIEYYDFVNLARG